MHRLAIRYGWTTFFILALVVFSATWSIQLADWADGFEMLTAITILGLVVGLLLARAEHVPSLPAHVIALVAGTLVVFYQMTSFLSDGLGGRRDKLAYLWDRWEQWYATVSQGQRAEDVYLFIVLMAGLTWVIAYLSVWFVFRSRWIWLAVLMPGVVVLLNLGYSRNVPTALIILYLFSSMLLLMRFAFAERELTWRRRGVPYPDLLVFRGLWVASYLAILVLVFGWVLPLSTQSQRALAVWEQVNTPWERIEQSASRWFGALRGPGSGGAIGGFASFTNSFELGGPLRLSEEPVLVVRGERAPYLVAHRYNIFTGQGWESDVGTTFTQLEAEGDEDVQPLSPYLRLEPGEEFPLPASSSRARVESTFLVEILRPRGAVVFTDQELLRTNVPTQIQTAWYTYENQQLLVREATPENTPPELWPLVELLQAADFSPPEDEADSTPASGSEPSASDEYGTPANLAEIEAEQERLRERQIETEYSISDRDYRVDTLTFSGQLPVYADVEAVFAEEGVRAGDQFEVTSLVTNASSEELRGASRAYPSEITSRYLQLPDRVSDRTRTLVEEIVGPHDNVYDRASAIERWLRENMEYREDVRLPADDVDLIDYFLFESRAGYCTYYASAMIQMLRIDGIPSRMVVGFYPAGWDSEANGFLYRDLNAHAWVEVYFPEYGWIPFEPTSARSLITRRPMSSGETGPEGSLVGGGMVRLPPDEFELYFEGLEDGAYGYSTGAALGDETSGTSWAIRGGLLLLLGLAAAWSYFWLRGLRGLTPTTQLFTKVQRGATWGGVPVSAGMTPYEYSTAISERIPEARPHVRLLADFYVRERYGRHQATPQELNRARYAWSRVRTLLLKYALLGRWRASGRRAAADDW